MSALCFCASEGAASNTQWQGIVEHRSQPLNQVGRDICSSPTSIEEKIAGLRCWNRAAGIYDNFFELGGDSILSIQIIARANQAGWQVTPKQLFENPTVAQQSRVQPQPSQLNRNTVFAAFDLIQHWFFEQKLCDPHHWNQALLQRCGKRLSLPYWSEQQLLEHHDALRPVYPQIGWQQVNAGWMKLKQCLLMHRFIRIAGRTSCPWLLLSSRQA